MRPEHLGSRRVIASVSGGRDSAALSLHLCELGIEHERVFMDTGWEHPLTYEYLRGPLAAALGPITEIRGPETFTELVNRKGIFPARNKRFCTEELKVKPMQRHLSALADVADIVNAVGIRRAESKARSEMPEWEWSDGFDCEVWRPLVTWTAADVLAIHERHGLALNPLYALGASRVGCWPCIHARKSEIALVAKVDPERIGAIAAQEAALNARALAGPKGGAFIERTMFSFHDGASKHFPLPIYQAVSWSQSKRGEWQPAGAAEGCMRHGICETATEES
jgi:3'-phosphoadenosine 5'-phosphosulfate sulfotransferase (PAPS reductase)/FAD synthetase